MTNLNEVFIVSVSRDHMSAEIDMRDQAKETIDEISLTEKDVKDFLTSRNIVYGINQDSVKKIISKLSPSIFPLSIAKGNKPVNGEDGSLEMHIELSTEIDRSEGWNFREVSRIPTVHEGEKLATKIAPTNGVDGKNVYGRTVKAKPGRPVLMNPGKNVELRQSDQSFYSTAVGQIQLLERFIHVQTVYELHESVSMKTGNINFAGSVIIRGDVPTGFSVQATGDITIYGLVEAATIISEGSVTVTEGLAGMKTGLIEAGEDVKIGYVNQGKIIAGNSVFVENSILHSECVAKKNIYCQRGNIIGGILSAGISIEAKDIGNRMNTTTDLSLGVDLTEDKKIQQLTKEKEKLTENLNKLSVLNERMEENRDQLDSKSRVTLLRLKKSLNDTESKLTRIDDLLEKKSAALGNIEDAYIKVRGRIHPNTIASFGRYKRRIDKNYDYVQIKMIENEINIVPN